MATGVVVVADPDTAPLFFALLALPLAVAGGIDLSGADFSVVEMTGTAWLFPDAAAVSEPGLVLPPALPPVLPLLSAFGDVAALVLAGGAAFELALAVVAFAADDVMFCVLLAGGADCCAVDGDWRPGAATFGEFAGAFAEV